MKLYKKGSHAILQREDQFYRWEAGHWDDLINRDDLHQYLLQLTADMAPVEGPEMRGSFDAPMGDQEIWAAGVTYLRSKEARMDEAKLSGGDIFYDKVYQAPRPELFFKANASRTVGCGDYVNIRKDSSWDVPEPELTLFINSGGSIQGYTIGNDMSSRSIEGENPLYLPQAKVFERCAALGPCLYIPEKPLPGDSRIIMQIIRAQQVMYQGEVRIDRMKRTHEELVQYLFRECRFPKGVFLMTGTCLVPSDDFTLKLNDQIIIEIDHIGTLTNQVAQMDR